MMATNEPRPTRAAYYSVVPSAAVALMSKFTCSVCLAACAGTLSSLGVGALATDRGLAGVTLALLAVGVGGVAWTTRRHRQRGPLAVTVIGAGIIVWARFSAMGVAWLYVGSAVLIAASLWNLWAGRRQPLARAGLGVRSRDQ